MLFILPHKPISFSRYLSCFDFLSMYKNNTTRKIRLISKFMTSQPETIARHILPNTQEVKTIRQ